MVKNRARHVEDVEVTLVESKNKIIKHDVYVFKEVDQSNPVDVLKSLPKVKIDVYRIGQKKVSSKLRKLELFSWFALSQIVTNMLVSIFI